METGRKFGISSERVRQIEFLKLRKRCKVHNRYFYSNCVYCLDYKNYHNQIKNLDKASFMQEVYKEADNRQRDALSVQHKTFLIKEMKDRYTMTFSQIARELQRDRTSIRNLYYK